MKKPEKASKWRSKMSLHIENLKLAPGRLAAGDAPGSAPGSGEPSAQI
jgi:hypothetical protein